MQETEDIDRAEIPVEYEVDHLGLISKYICPHCKSDAIEKAHIDDAKTQWFKCWECEKYSYKLFPKIEPCLSCKLCFTSQCYKLKDKKLAPKQILEIYEKDEWITCRDLETIPEPKKKPTILEHINEIENPNLAGKPVIFEAVISSTSIPFTIPSKIESIKKEEDKNGNKNLTPISREIALNDSSNIALTSIHVLQQQKFLKNLLNTKSYVTQTAYRTIYLLRVRPPVFTLEKKGEKLVDAKGYEYKPFDIYVISDNPLHFITSSIVQFEGVILPNPKTQKTTILAYKIALPDDVKNFNVKELEKLKEIFAEKTTEERLNWIVENYEIYSQLIGRKNLIISTFLAYFSPLYVKFNGDIQRGFANNLHIGDTTCGKSHNQRKATGLLKAGVLITAETASTVGLLGTASQMAGKEWFVDWGFLPLQDQKLLAIDGAQKLSSSNWAALAETERTGIVNIAKAAKSTAYARTRQIKIANPVDIEENKYSTKSLANFLYPIQSLSTILDKTSIARLDIAVFADQRDVKPDAINIRHETEYNKEIHNLSELLKWCWCNNTKIIFTTKAETYLLQKATELYNKFFCEQIPLVSIDVKWKLARLSVATAYLTLSTEDFCTLTVTEAHVKFVVDFLDTEYCKAGLNSLAKSEKLDVLQIEDVKDIYDNIVEATKARLWYDQISEILKFIVIQGHITKDKLKTQFDLADNNQLRPLLATLDNEKLLNRKRGYYPTPKMIQAYKIVESPEFNTINTIINPREDTPQKSKQETLEK